MRIVLDTTMLFSLLLGKNLRMRDIFFDPAHQFYAPNFIVTEIFQKKEKILRCSALSEEEVHELFHRLLSRITFINEDVVSHEYKVQAYKLCCHVDGKDTPFIALALQLNVSVWTGDIRLKMALINQGFSQFFEPTH